MSAHREQELKFRVTAADHASLRDGPAFGVRRDPVRLTNHYFDTADLELARRRILLRIRTEEPPGRCVLTLKCGEEVAPGLFDSLEVEHELPEGTLEAALGEPATLWKLESPAVSELSRRVGRVPLQKVGALVTERVRREISGIVLEVDRVTFPDGSVAHELEIETDDPDAVRSWVHRELVVPGMRLEPQRRTKLEQLLDWLARAGGVRPEHEDERTAPRRCKSS